MVVSKGSESASVEAAVPTIKVEIPEDSQHKRVQSHPPPLPLGPLRVEDESGSCPVLLPASEMSPTLRIDFTLSKAHSTSFEPREPTTPLGSKPDHLSEDDVGYWKSQVVEVRRQNLALQVRCQLVERAFSNAKNMISNLILLYQGSDSSEPELILEMGMKLRVAPDMGNLNVVQDLLRKTNAIAEKILLYNFELQKNLNDLKEDNTRLRTVNEALKQNHLITPGNRVASFEVPSRVSMHERAVSNALRRNDLGNSTEGLVGVLGVFGGIHPNPEQTIPSNAGNDTALSVEQPASRSEPRKLFQTTESGFQTPTSADMRWRALVSKLRGEIAAATTKVQKLERRIRMMVEAKYEMIENFSIELERLRSSGRSWS